MKKVSVIGAALAILEKAGFYVASIQSRYRTSFDVIARRDETLIVVRIVRNIDSLTREMCRELKLISYHLNASAIIIGEKNTHSPLETGVVYSRYDIPIIALETLEDLFLHGIEPISHSAHGGYYVAVDGQLLQKIRLERKIPLSTLAENAGVSKRAIQMYEHGMDVSIDTAFRLEEFLGVPLMKSTNILDRMFDELLYDMIDYSRCDSFEKEVIKQLERMGTHVVPIFKCPFNALTGEQDSIIITGITELYKDIRKRIEIVSKISRISEKRSMFIVNELRSRKSVRGTPLVGRSELDSLEEAEDIDKLLENRS